MLNPFYQQARDNDNPDNPFAPKYSLNVQTGLPDNSFQAPQTLDTSLTPGSAPQQPQYNLGVQGDANAQQMPQGGTQVAGDSQNQMSPIDKDAFYQMLQQQMMNRSASGMQNSGQNMVTGDDIANQKNNENLNSFASSLAGAMNTVASRGGNVPTNNIAPLAQSLNQSGQNALAQKQAAYKTANEDVAGGLQGLGQIQQQQNAQVDFKNKQKLADPDSAESVYARQFAKDAFGKDVPPGTTALQMQQFIPLMEKKYAIDQQAQSRKDVAQARADALRESANTRADAAGERKNATQQKTDEKTEQTIGESLDPTKGKAGQYGEYIKKVDNADAINQLIREKNGDLKNLDSRQMNELAIGVNRMLGGSEAASSIAHLVPHTIVGDTSKVIEWLTNDPKGTDQQAFVKKMAETVDREHQVWSDKAKAAAVNRLHNFDSYFARNPDRLQAVLDQHGITMDQYKANKPLNMQTGQQSPSQPDRQVVAHGADLP